MTYVGKLLVFFVFCAILNCNSQELKVTHQVYFDVAIENDNIGRITIGLFGELTPKTVKNFYTIATKGINGVTYSGSVFHRVVRKFIIQGGDIINGNGTGSISIYGETFKDENFKVNHTAPGLVSMANLGPDTNGCQFFITTIPTPWLDGKHTVFGKVIYGQNLVHKIEQVKTDYADRPLLNVKIIKSGSIPTQKYFYVTAEHQYTLLSWLRAGAVPLSFSFAILFFFHWVIRKLDMINEKIE